MSIDSLPESWSDRLRWVLSEGALLAAVFVFWVLVAVALTVAFGVAARLLQVAGIRQFEVVYRVFSRADLVWAAVVPLTAATASLYVLARAGTMLLDRYQRAA